MVEKKEIPACAPGEETSTSTAIVAGENRNPNKPFICPVVGIGASAGGLEAFVELLGALDVSTGMAFVLVQHLDPNHQSLLTDILARATTMPVIEVTNDRVIKPDHIYVIPPNTRMTIVANHLKLEPRGSALGQVYLPIDAFFNSLATEHHENAIGVILSGTGSDGAKGLAAIVAHGGVTFAQDKTSAKFDGMPSAAIASGVDFILTPKGIAQELRNIAFNSKPCRAALNQDSSPHPVEEPHDIKKILKFLDASKGMNCASYKLPTVQRRILRRMAIRKLDNVDEYISYLGDHPIELDSLYEDILIKVTSFFRNPESFLALRKLVFPVILARKPSTIRIWVPGCSTGEEAYSIAISLFEFMEDIKTVPRIEIFATDVSESALAKARLGQYNDSIVDQVSPARLRRFFIKESSGFRVGPRIRECCIFARQNVTKDPPFSKLDLISCRNLLIYLTPATQKKVMATFHFALNPDGFLTLGSSETIGESTDIFDVTSSNDKIFSRKPGATGTHSLDSVMDIPLKRTGDHPVILQAHRDEVVKSSDNIGHAERIILDKFVPCGVVVNERMEILQVRGDTSSYLKLPAGKPSINLAKLCRSGLLSELRTSIHEAGVSGNSVRKNGWIKEPGKKSIPVVIDVIPFRDSPSSQNQFVVLFGLRSILGRKPAESATDQLNEVQRVERELVETKDYLNSIIEKEQATNEELKSASEEILSANEELQSGNEEMATAKEEIQATNEELITLNDELQNRNQELGLLNNDLTNLFGNAQIPIVMLSENLTVRRFTQSAEKILNLTPKDIGLKLSDIEAKLYVAGLPALVFEVLESLKIIDQEVQDRKGRWYSLRIKPYRTYDNKIEGAVIALVDIDSLKRSVDHLTEAYSYSEAIVQTAPVPLLVLDEKLRVITANKAFYKKFNLNELATKDALIYDLGNGQWQVPKLRELLEDILPKNESMEDFIVEHDFPDLGLRTMRLSARRLLQHGDQAAKILLGIQDITEEKNTEDHMRSAKVAAETANQAKSDFLANISHEIRTPLGAILGYSEILADPNHQPDPKMLQSAHRIKKNVEHLTELIDEILDIAKIEAGKLEVEREPFALLPLLYEIYTLLGDRAHDKGLTLDIVFDGDIPETIVACPKRLWQILFNIVGNSIKFTDRGSITINVKLARTGDNQSNSKLSFVVSDTGCGLTVDQQSRLFKPFSQGDSSVTRRYGGTGLGLMLARRLAEVLGGNVNLAESQSAKGSVFNITIDPGPLEGVVMLKNITKETLSQYKDTSSNLFIANQKLSGLRGLLVEDGADNQVLIKYFLTASGALVDTAKNGAEGVRLAQASDHDFVVMDIQMPVLDGYEATKKLVTAGYKTPIIALTAHAMHGERERCLGIGCAEYISKPVSGNVLIDTVTRAIKKKVSVNPKKPHRSPFLQDPALRQLVGKFVKNLPTRVAALQAAQRNSDWNELANQAHQMAGAAGGYGFPELGNVAARIEAQAREPSNPRGLASSISAFASLCDDAIRHILH